MRLTELETFIVGNPWKNWVFIKLRTDAGIHGVGEATVHRKAKTVEEEMAKRPYDESHFLDLFGEGWEQRTGGETPPGMNP
jgi:galactonate dehydratase